MKNHFLLAAFALFGIGAIAQNEPLFKIENEVVTVDEFKNIYLKNKDVGKGIDPKTPEEYLELYINFKLKVQEAKSRGLDTLPKFKREFGNYRSQLSAPYLSDKRIDTLLVKEAYERMKLEVKAAHIMLELSGDALPEDTARIYNQMLDIRKEIVSGKISFEAAAEKYSVDKGTAVRGGDLGYFTAFTMVYPFESAAYNTNVGEISLPVRSQFGYHLIKVANKRKANGRVKVAHILVKSSDNDEIEDKMNAQKKIKEIHHRIKMGDDFGMTAKQYSDDKASAQQGGVLEPFSINTMMVEFEEAAFALQNPGDFSAPIKTAIGYHVIKLLEKYPVPSFEEAEADLFRKVGRDTRSLKGKEALVVRLKQEYKFIEYPKALKEFEKVVNKDYVDGTWTVEAAKGMKKPLFVFADQKITQEDFTRYLATQMPLARRNPDPKIELYKQYKGFVEQTIIGYENNNLENKYPSFKYLVNEYRDGILLFDLTEELIWNRAITDSVGIHNFYEANKQQYMWDTRVEATIYQTESEKVAKAVRKMIQKGADQKTILEKINKKSELALQIESGVFSKGRNPLVDQVTWQVGLSENINHENKVVFVEIKQVLEPMPKRMEEARGLITSDYQKQLEREWIQELRKKYQIEVLQANLEKIKRELD